MNNKKLQFALPILFSIVMVFGMIIGYQLRDHSRSRTFLSFDKKSNIQELIDLLQYKYVDDIKMDSINEITINELLSHLDPHSVYIPASELQTTNDELMGNFQGIGVEFQVFNDTVNVIKVLANNPAEKAGIQVGDKLLKANDSISLLGSKNSLEKIASYIRGTKGSSVKLQILRNNTIIQTNVIRENIKVSTIDAAYMIAPNIGLIKINKFGDRTYEEFMEQLEKLQKQKMQHLILDLRGNGGGFLNEAIDIADEFLDADKLIVYTKGAHNNRADFKCKRDGLFEKGKLMVLVDETSASASEVLAGALQDWDRATIIGRRTFGKGLVQQQFQLSDGSAVRLTVSRYYTPVGRNIQKPYSTTNFTEYENEIMNRFKDGELQHGVKLIDTNKAYKTLSGKKVYAGGGIVPDYFIAIDTTQLNKPIQVLYTNNIFNKVAYLYFVENKKNLQQQKNMQSFNAIISDNNVWILLTQVCAKENISTSTINPFKNFVLNEIKNKIAEFNFDGNGYYNYINTQDSCVLKAISLLK